MDTAHENHDGKEKAALQRKYETTLHAEEARWQIAVHDHLERSDSVGADAACVSLVDARRRIIDEMSRLRLRIPEGYADRTQSTDYDHRERWTRPVHTVL